LSTSNGRYAMVWKLKPGWGVHIVRAVG